ncbi:MAG: hypothetical protein IJO05_01210, partial [Oscillospiraceae bacterium]|nr:hypothetical protein [Oscillospiraceae bacterium]
MRAIALGKEKYGLPEREKEKGRVAKCCNTPLVKREKRRVKRKCVPSGLYLKYFRKKIPFLFSFHSS